MNSLWLSDKEIFNNNNFNSSLDLNLTTDVCIIGAGIFGLTCAYYLTKLGYNVTVLEKSDIASKATRTYYRKNYKPTWFIL